jgi:hypothetical protein
VPTTLAAPRCDQIIARVADHHTGSPDSCAEQAVDVTLALYPTGATFDPAGIDGALAAAFDAHPQVDTSGSQWRIHTQVPATNPNTCPTCHLERTLSGDCPLGC